MASIKKEGDSWLFVIDLPRDPVTNKRRQRKRRGFKTKKEAQAAAAALYTELTQGIVVDESKMTFLEFSNFWLDEYSESGKVKPSSVRARFYSVKIVQKYFKNIPIKNISKLMYKDMLNSEKERGSSDNTIRLTHAVSKMMFKRAMELDIIKSNPTEYATIPSRQKTVEELENEDISAKYLELDELNRFLETARVKGLVGDYELFTLLAYTGMRIGELIALKESDLDFKENTISITKTCFCPDDIATGYHLQTPKSKKSKRVIDTDPVVMKLMETFIASNKELKMAYRNTYHDKGFVFPNRWKYPGYPQVDKRVSGRMDRLLKLSGLNADLTPHSLRHTHTSLLAEAGVPLQEIMDRLGHEDDKTTKKVYLHVTKTRKKEAVKMFGDLMNSVKS